MHVADGASDIYEDDYGVNFVDHPSIKAIVENNRKWDTPCSFNF